MKSLLHTAIGPTKFGVRFLGKLTTIAEQKNLIRKTAKHTFARKNVYKNMIHDGVSDDKKCVKITTKRQQANKNKTKKKKTPHKITRYRRHTDFVHQYIID